MTIFGVRAWRFVLMVLAAEIAPILVLVLAMFVVGTVQGCHALANAASLLGADGFYRIDARGANRRDHRGEHSHQEQQHGARG
jgi:hypothetical protein